MGNQELVCIVFPVSIALCLIVRKLLDINGYTFYLCVLVIAIVVVNFGADYLTRKKFED